MRGIVLALALSVYSFAASAYTKPQGAPEVVIPSRGVTV